MSIRESQESPSAFFIEICSRSKPLLEQLADILDCEKVFEISRLFDTNLVNRKPPFIKTFETSSHVSIASAPLANKF